MIIRDSNNMVVPNEDNTGSTLAILNAKTCKRGSVTDTYVYKIVIERLMFNDENVASHLVESYKTAKENDQELNTLITAIRNIK